MGRAPGASKAVTPVPPDDSNLTNQAKKNDEVENIVGEIPRVESTALLSYFAPSSGAAMTPSPGIHKPSAVRPNKGKREQEIQPRKNAGSGNNEPIVDNCDTMEEVEIKPKRLLMESFQPFHLNTFRRQLFSLFDEATNDDNDNQPLDEHQKQILHVKQMTWNASVQDIIKYLSPTNMVKEPLKEELQNLLVEEEEQAWYQMYFDMQSLLQEFIVKRTRKFIQSSPLMQVECDLELTELYLLQSVARDLSFHHQRKREPETAQYASHAFQPTHTGQMFIPDHQANTPGNEDAAGGVIFTPVSHPIIPPSGPLQLPIDLVAGSVINPISNMHRQQHQQQKKQKHGSRPVSPTPSHSSQLAQFVSPHNQFKDFEGMLDRQYHRHIRALDRLLDGYRVSVAPFRTGGSLGHEQRDRALLVTAGPEALLQHQLHHNQQLHLQQNKYYSNAEQSPVSPSMKKKTKKTTNTANPEEAEGEEEDNTRNIPLTNIPSAFDLLPAKENKSNAANGEDLTANQNDIRASWNQLPPSKATKKTNEKVAPLDDDNDINSDQTVRFEKNLEINEEFQDKGTDDVPQGIKSHDPPPSNERPLNLAKAFHLDQQVDYHAQNVQKLRRQVMHALLSGIEIRCVAALAPLLSLVVLELHHLAEDDNSQTHGFDQWLTDVVLNPFSCQRSNDIVQGEDDQVRKGNFVHIIESLLHQNHSETPHRDQQEEEVSFLAACDWHEFVFHKAQKQVHMVEKWSATLTAAIEHNLEVARKAGQSLCE